MPRSPESKILTSRSFLHIVHKLKAQGARIVLTNGCFDLVHAGHARYLAQAKRLGDCLIVGVNSDRSVRRLKGPRRPILGEQDRLAVVASLECVDYVIPFGGLTPLRLIKRIRPDVLAKGADWSKGQIVGAELVESYGGRVVRIPLLPGRSTSQIIQGIRGGGQ